MTDTPERLYLSPPHMVGTERTYVDEAFETNWIAPLGPHVDAFEREFCERVHGGYGAATNSGTAALHLALSLVGVEAGDDVMVSTFTFAASVYPIAYLDARPIFVDSERRSWNLDPELLANAIEARARKGRLPKAVVPVHIYGQSVDLDPVLAICRHHGIAVVEDAAEALGATYRGRSPGTLGRVGIFSFNGNKIITTSGGGMLVSEDPHLVARARKLAAQARDPAPHYQHTDIGYNYRLSNVLAGIGRAQLRALDDRVAARRRNFDYYYNALNSLPGIDFMPEAAWGTHTRWLTTLTIDPEDFGADRETVRLAMEAQNIEARPLWKPMHLQPVFSGCERVGGTVAEGLFDRGLCLPSGSNMSEAELERVVAVFRSVSRTGSRHS